MVETIDRPVTDPVKVDYRPANQSVLRTLLNMRGNLLSLWPEYAYRIHFMNFKAFNQNYFVCNSPDSVRHVFLDHHDNYDRKSPQMRHALTPLLGDGLFVSDGDLWRERRQSCSPAFAIDLLPGFAGIMVKTAKTLADRWATLPDGGAVDMLDEMGRLTATIIGRTVFGDDVADEEAGQVIKGFAEYQSLVEGNRFAEALGLPFLAIFGNPVRRLAARRAIAKVHKVIDRIIDTHRPTNEDGSFTLLSLLRNGMPDDGTGKASGCPLSSKAARNEAIVMFMAGHETTANTLAWTWYLLDHSPHVADKLHEELDRVLAGRVPTYEDVTKLPYTRAILEEAMRLYPPVPFLSRQAREADEIQGRKVSADTIVTVSPWLLHRHRLHWDRPDSFIPERFMPDRPRPDKFVYMPFSVGPRVCLGQRFGLTEAILCLATLAQRFTARLRPGTKVEIECNLTIRPRGGLPMILEKRVTGP